MKPRDCIILLPHHTRVWRISRLLRPCTGLASGDDGEAALANQRRIDEEAYWI